jgi:hypothetical protein
MLKPESLVNVVMPFEVVVVNGAGGVDVGSICKNPTNARITEIIPSTLAIKPTVLETESKRVSFGIIHYRFTP